MVFGAYFDIPTVIFVFFFLYTVLHLFRANVRF